MYPVEIVTPMTQRLSLDTWLQRDYGDSGHDGLVGYHIHEILAEVVERCCVADVSRYSYLHSTDGCVYRLHWDQGGDRVSVAVWIAPMGWLHHIWHGEVGTSVEQRKFEGGLHGRLLRRLPRVT